MDQHPTGIAGLTTWDQQNAKAKFSEVVRRARAEGPQVVTTRGAKPVVVLSADAYLALVAPRKLTYLDLLMPGEPWEAERLDMPAIYEPFEF